MELVNATRMQAAFTQGLDPSGREHIVVVVKGAFAIPGKGREVLLAEEQVPLVMADEFTGQPGLSAPRYESEYALRKPRCDVLLNGHAYAPRERSAERVTVSLTIGPLTKSFNVVGNRDWKRSLTSASPAKPEPFLRMPISYDKAFGGTYPSDNNPEQQHAYLANPVGVGFARGRDVRSVIGKPVPNTEELSDPVAKPDGDYHPMSFGPIGRNWQPRAKLAGTYDQNWVDNVFPFPPADFDERYYQSAPADQQMDYPRGGEPVVLVNLTASGQVRFNLPMVEVPVEFTDAANKRTQMQAVLDTVIIEPDLGRLLLIWRSSLALRRNLLEMKEVVVGRMPRGFYLARQLSKTYYPSLGSLTRGFEEGSPEEAEEVENDGEGDEDLDEEDEE